MRPALRWVAIACCLWCAPSLAASELGRPVRIGSKKFTESVILGELITQLVSRVDPRAEHRRQLGGTRVLFNGLLAGEIDCYPEYTGTLAEEILAGSGLRTEQQIRRALAERGIQVGRQLGFNNTYAIGMRRAVARQLGIASISDLRSHPELRLGFTNEFIDRADGWPGLRRTYRLPQRDVRGLDHDLAYRGLQSGELQAIDLYSTDAEIRYYDLQILRDDLSHFPDYQAVVLCRADLPQRAPGAWAAIERLEGRIDQQTMARLNARVKLDRVAESRVAADFLSSRLGHSSRVREPGWLERLSRRTLEHLLLVLISLGAAVVVAVPLGIAAARWPRIGQGILSAVGVIQTIPSLALLVFMIPLVGIGGPPAVLALFLYSLLPIVRNTHAGLNDVPLGIRESAEALGLPAFARLRLVELPMAARSILAGIKTSAVINVGTATLGALIGAGGYGQPILTGIRLDDLALILQGAVPAACLALLVQLAFDALERLLVPRGLRRGSLNGP